MEWEMNSAFRGGTVKSLTEGMDVGRGEELGPLWSTTGGFPVICVLFTDWV